MEVKWCGQLAPSPAFIQQLFSSVFLPFLFVCLFLSSLVFFYFSLLSLSSRRPSSVSCYVNSFHSYSVYGELITRIDSCEEGMSPLTLVFVFWSCRAG